MVSQIKTIFEPMQDFTSMKICQNLSYVRAKRFPSFSRYKFIKTYTGKAQGGEMKTNRFWAIFMAESVFCKGLSYRNSRWAVGRIHRDGLDLHE